MRDYLFLFFLNPEFNKLFFVFRDQMVVRAPRKTWIIKSSIFVSLLHILAPNFQFRDLRKINNYYESIEWHCWVFVSCYLQSCFFFFPFQAVFQTLLYHFFLCVKTRQKNGTLRANYVTRKLKWKFDILDSWSVTFWSVSRARNPLCVPVRLYAGRKGFSCCECVGRVHKRLNFAPLCVRNMQCNLFVSGNLQ